MIWARSLTCTLLMSLSTWFALPSPCVAAQLPAKGSESFEGVLNRIEERTEGNKTIKVAILQTTENGQLEVLVRGPGIFFNRLTRGDTVEVRYSLEKEVKPVKAQAVQVKQGQLQGTLEQVDQKASVKVKSATQSEVFLLPVGPADLAKGLSPGDIVEGIYTQEGFDKPKILRAIGLRRANMRPRNAVAAMGLGIVGFLVIAMVLLKAGGFKLRKLVIGGDGRTSNSKTQATIWFGIVISSYMATLLARIWHGGWGYVGAIDIPQNLLILSGISAGTFAGAKLVTANRVALGYSKPTANTASPVNLFTNDHGQFDLGDFQMFAWALLAAGVYLLQMIAFLKTLPLSASVSLPDVDSTLLSFFGIGQGAYLAKKGLGEVQARVSGITPPQAAPGATVVISGNGFGDVTGYVRFGTAMARVISWRDTTLTVETPALSPGEVPTQVSLPPPAVGMTEVSLQAVSFRILPRPQ